jgi:hypothetical protein
MEVGNSVRQELEYLLKKYNIYDENTAVLAISSNRDTMSMITWSSQNAQNVFNSNDSLRGSSINLYMPTVFKRHHDHILKRFYQTGREMKCNNLMHSWGLDQ